MAVDEEYNRGTTAAAAYDALVQGSSGDPSAPATAGSNDDFYNKLFGLGLSAGVEFLGGNDPKVEKAGYQGGIPDYIASRTAVPGTNNPDRRPGSSGRQYFTDINFKGPAADTAGLAALNAANPSLESSSPFKRIRGYTQNITTEAGWLPPPSDMIVTQAMQTWRNTKTGESYITPSGGYTPPSDDWVVDNGNMYAGGIAQLNSGAYLNGASDGMADRIPATIEGSQEARLSDGEFVIPADVVGGLGNGNSSAGAKTLYNMMDRVRMARTGTKKQGTQINPNKMMPV